MVHHPDVIIPATISYGSSSGPKALTDIVHNAGGFRKTNRLWKNYLRRFQLGFNVRSPESMAVMLSIWEAIGGPHESCNIIDHNDWNTTEGSMGSNGLASITKDDQPLRNTTDGTFLGDGTTTSFQMVKVRNQGAAAQHIRTITQPRLADPTILIAIDTVLQTIVTDYDNDSFPTGLVEFVTAPGVGELPTWGGAFYVPVAFTDDEFIQQLTTFDLSSVPNIEMMEVRIK